MTVGTILLNPLIVSQSCGTTTTVTVTYIASLNDLSSLPTWLTLNQPPSLSFKNCSSSGYTDVIIRGYVNSG